MVRLRLVITVLLLGALIPAAACAHRRPTTSERAALTAAVVRQGQLSRAQTACQTITISTVNPSYATLSWPAKLSRACLKVAADGVIVEHRVGMPWKLVTVGSDLRCPIKSVPTRVSRDLGLCP